MTLDNTTWTAMSIDGVPVDHAEITAVFSDGTLSGSAGCNRYSGAYEISGSSITFPAAFISTLMACEESIMAQEQRFLSTLETVQTYIVVDGRLTLTNADGETVFVFAEVSQDLEGTSWSLLSYLDGNARVSVITGTTAGLTFTGTEVSGPTGCNHMNGTFTRDGDSVVFNDLMTTEMACGEPAGIMEQEQAIHVALEQASTYRIDGRILTIWNAEGRVVLELERQ